jgi:hypothetical protein
MADAVMEAIRGTTVAQKVLHDIRGGCASPDALLDAIAAAGNGARLRGLVRTVQKALEAKA